jgi:hypothetical protein
MNWNDVLDSYVAEVVRRLPAKERGEVGLELRGLLGEMLEERAAGAAPDDALVLDLLRGFGTPAEVAARYRAPGFAAIPADRTRSFALLSLAGIALQWALTLPRVFDGLPLTGWWLSWGLGAFWWPGFLAMMSLAGAWFRHRGWFRPAWRPRVVDPERVERAPTIFGLAAFATGVGFMVALPWLAPAMPGVLPQVFAFDPGFLHGRAWPVLPLWAAAFAVEAAVLARGRWWPAARRLSMGISLAFVALLAWWMAAGPIFLAAATDQGAKAALGLVIAIILVEVAYRLRRRPVRFRAQGAAG